MSLIDSGVMRSLQLDPTGSAKYHSSSTNGVAQPCDVFDVCLVLGGLTSPNTLKFDPMQAIGGTFLNQGYDGLLGRDVLGRVQMAWNGPGQQLTLFYP